MTNKQPIKNPPKPKKAPGFSLFGRLMGMFMSLIVLFGIILVIPYQIAVPEFVQEQVKLRAESITQLFAATVLAPVATKDYLRINKIAEATSDLPGVAYATVINADGTAIAGIFGDISKFDASLRDIFYKDGFPQQIITDTRLNKNRYSDNIAFKMGGQEILEYATRLGNTGAEIHVGLFASENTHNIYWMLLPALVALLVVVIIGNMVLFWMAHILVVPIHQLCHGIEAMVKGDLDQDINNIKSTGEMWQLVSAVKLLQVKMRELSLSSTPPSDSTADSTTDSTVNSTSQPSA